MCDLDSSHKLEWPSPNYDNHKKVRIEKQLHEGKNEQKLNKRNERKQKKKKKRWSLSFMDIRYIGY